jgi:hypothetical protein
MKRHTVSTGPASLTAPLTHAPSALPEGTSRMFIRPRTHARTHPLTRAHARPQTRTHSTTPRRRPRRIALQESLVGAKRALAGERGRVAAQPINERWRSCIARARTHARTHADPRIHTITHARTHEHTHPHTNTHARTHALAQAGGGGGAHPAASSGRRAACAHPQAAVRRTCVPLSRNCVPRIPYFTYPLFLLGSPYSWY